MYTGRKVPSAEGAEGRFLYGRKLLNNIFSKISLYNHHLFLYNNEY